MSNELWVLILAAASIGFFHTLFGPDHYLPFIVMSKSGQWSLRKTSLITFLCGLGHVLSSVLLGSVGVAFGIAVTKLEILESFRGNLAAWLLIAFGLVYFIWGARRAWRNKAHHHLHSHKNGDDHEHSHSHHTGHVHAHVEKGKKSMTPWVLFTIFIFGPCEPLIPLLMYPAAKGGFWNIIIVTGVFAAVTIGTMMSVVLISAFGINCVPVLKLERYTHALAGATIFLCGMSIQFLGL
jgi:ABC-type nickel/cobalt efflux system permease component RcnA